MKRIRIFFIILGILLMIPGVYLIFAYVLMNFNIGLDRNLASFAMWLAGAITLFLNSGILDD